MVRLYFASGITREFSAADEWEFDRAEPSTVSIYDGDQILGIFFTAQLLGWYLEPEPLDVEAIPSASDTSA